MATARDFEFTDDLVIENGDFKVIDSDKQHQEHIIRAEPGHFYEYPTLGAGAGSLLLSSETNQRIKQVIEENLIADNFRVNQIFIERGDIDERGIETDAIRIK